MHTRESMRSPVPQALTSLALGIAGKIFLDTSFSVGWTMVVVLVMLPAVGVLITIDDYLPRGPGARASKEPGLLASREHRLELAAMVTLPAIGFAMDGGHLTPTAACLWVVGLAGVSICVMLVRDERSRGKADG